MISGSYINEERKKIYYERGDWTDKTVFNHFLETASRHPNKLAIVDNQNKVTYDKLLKKSTQLANYLQYLKVKKGDFVSVQLPNWIESVIAYLACTQIGAVYNPIPITARAKELEYMLSLCESKVLILPDYFRNYNYIEMVTQVQKTIDIPNILVVQRDSELVALPPEFQPFTHYLTSPYDEPVFSENVSSDDPLVVLFTSGTESNPKGVIHTHNTVLFGERKMAEILDITENDAVFMASPITHTTGFLHGINLPIIVGAKSVLMEKFKADKALEMMSDEKCTFTMGATPFLHDILNELSTDSERFDLSYFRFFLCGGAPIPRELIRKSKKVGFKVLSVYGSTESPPHTVSRLDDTEDVIVSTDGAPLPNIEVKIVDENRNELPIGEVGEQASRGPNTFIGYYKNQNLTKQYLDEDGWYYSGDLAKLNEHNYVRIIGRKKDIIIRGGQNISPGEVEDILFKYPKIKSVAIVGIPDERMGEKSCAFVVPKSGEIITLEELIEFLEKQNIAKYKYPESLKIINEMPMTASGKIQKYKLKKMK